jgi:hypothetical protein
MKKIQMVLVSAALAIGMPAPSSAAASDPEVIIYRFAGVHDDGSGDGAGVATVFHCTNFSGATENLRFVTRNIFGTIATNVTASLQHLFSLAMSTHLTQAYSGAGFSLSTGAVVEGTIAIAATSTNIICTAMVIDAANQKPVGIALRGIRFSPVPGSQE